MYRYVPISIAEFKAVMTEMGFEDIEVPGNYEYVFERKMNEPRFSVRILSSISLSNGMTRDSGEDVIRVMLYDHVLDRPSYNETIKRTKNALSTLRNRAREAWVYKNHHKCQCGAIMTLRMSQTKHFFGCTAYPTCKNTKVFT